ncbi:MAG: YeiH family protein [Gammaproteobacteria bacterium]|nr:putative sulfate exporter family transporter [Rhodocyclaceae bacterium]MBU3910291.1 YeiH family protein [Gammaproteobacteria bacterium]MBU4004118.1 YeiH family protein [Gammaproteobacteria bacterium]MBU4020365.1 YeiH family protein [Gammaproteobacteria bacterium]MBU4095441.1 YeiH family protein [Gammaproteobacteria bacterium]
MSGGGIGVEFSLKNLPIMLPGLILCAVFGWMALQWDATMSGWNRDFKEAEKVLKAVNDGKAPASFAEYKQKHTDSFAKKTEEFKAAEAAFKAAAASGDESVKAPKKPSKPVVLQEADFNQIAQAKAIPGKLNFGSLMISFQLTYVAMLLLIGMLIRNTVGLPEIFKAGTVAARPLIKPGIIILGAYYMWTDVLKVGFFGLALVVAFVMGTQVLISFWAKRAKVDPGLAGVMGAGVGVCGVSAAVAVAPVVNAKPRDFFYAIGTILLFGTIGLFTFPYIGKALGMSDPVFGAWVGTAILNTAQLVAAASWYSHESLLTANVINIVRVGFIPLIVLWAIYFYVVKPAVDAGHEGQKINVWEVVTSKFPIFVFGFFIMVTMNEMGFFAPEHRSILAADLLKLFFALGFAGVGLNIAFDDLKKAGGSAFMIGVVSATLKAVLAAVAVMAIGADAFKVKG